MLVLGGGGREHAIVRALAQSDTTIYGAASTRNPGIAALADDVTILDETDPNAVIDYATAVGATLAVIGPEAPLEAGVADALSDAGIFPFGPSADHARIETDKAFQRRFMADHDIPGCPTFETFTDPAAACRYIDEVEYDLAVKPAGLTGGKGVKVIGDQVTPEEAKEYIRNGNFDEIVLEERLIGEEFTVQAFVANGTLRTTPAVQDHKRAYEGDTGPNTGGMGSYSDRSLALPFMDESDYTAAVDILKATVDALGEYTGVLYGQFMLTTDGVKVIEFNARFGDPEAMNTLPVMNTPFLDILIAAREGERLPRLSFAPRATVCKYAVPTGYPTDPDAGARLSIDVELPDGAILFYASVDEREDGIYTTTSRSFAVVGIAETIEQAEAIADDVMQRLDGEGLHIRHDIGRSELVTARIEHIESLRENSHATGQ